MREGGFSRAGDAIEDRTLPLGHDAERVATMA
jgi:hypothetical protein